MLKTVGKGALGAPGLALSAAGIFTAENKAREGAKFAGGAVGGAIGTPAGPVGVAIGSYLGTKGGAWLYDHQDDIVRGFGEAVTRGYGSPSNDARVRRLVLGY